MDNVTPELATDSPWSRTIVWYTGGFTDNTPETPALDGEQLVAFLTEHFDAGCTLDNCIGRLCPGKMSAVSWSPATYPAGAIRDDDNVLSINYAVFDLDHLKPGQLDVVRAVLDDPDSAGFEYIVHSTHSHRPDDECYRLIFPVSRPILPAEWPLVRPAIVAALGLPADGSTKDLSRLYAAPTERGGVEPYAVHQVGKPIDVDEALAVARQLGIASPPKATSVMIASPASNTPAAPIALGALRECLSRARRSKSQGSDHQKEQAALLGRVLDGEPLGPIGQRHNARIRMVGLVAHWLPPATPWPAVLELLRPCLTATPLAAETFDGAVEKTRKLYEDSMAARLATDAQFAAARAATQALRDKVQGSAPRPSELPADADWKDLLLKTGRGKVRGCDFNARLLLRCAPEFSDCIRWNEVTKQIEVVDGPFAGYDADTLPGAAASLFQRAYDFMGGEQVVRAALPEVARANSYDPIAEQLNEAAWDGVPRIDDFLEKYCGVVSDDDRQALYVKAVSRRWLISLVARALRPGCKVDTVLILEGAQGKKKSTALETLVGSEYFLDTAITVGEKDAMLAISTAWLVELGELASLRRAESDRIKQFISSKVDRFRPPFGAAMKESPRRCVLVGTCNPEEGVGYLKDRTGNRRYWPVRVSGDIDVEAIARNREIILAEAVVAFRAGERWWLEGVESDAASAETEAREDESAVAEAIERWWYGMNPGRRPGRVTTLDVAQAIGVADYKDVDRVRREIGSALKQLGFKPGRIKGRPRHYDASAELLNAPARTPAMMAAGLALVGRS